VEHFFQRQALATTTPLGRGHSMPLLPSYSSSNVPPSWQLGRSLVLRCVGKHAYAMKALALLAPIVASSKIVLAL
jgi:hypothetical protein